MSTYLYLLESKKNYIDYLMLMKLHGRWVIIHKMFIQQIKERKDE